MDRLQTFLKKIVGGGNKPDSGNESKEDMQSAIKRARESIDLFIHSPVQKEIVSYYAKEGATFDFSKNSGNPPTILRMEWSEGNNNTLFDWLIIVDDDSNHGFLFHIIADPGLGRKNDSDGILRVAKRYMLNPINLIGKSSIEISDFIDLITREREANDVCKKVDVMSGGIVERKSNPVRVAQSARDLNFGAASERA